MLGLQLQTSFRDVCTGCPIKGEKMVYIGQGKTREKNSWFKIYARNLQENYLKKQLLIVDYNSFNEIDVVSPSWSL